MSASSFAPAKTTGLALPPDVTVLDDPRQLAKVLFPLPEIRLLGLSAITAGADDPVAMHE